MMNEQYLEDFMKAWSLAAGFRAAYPELVKKATINMPSGVEYYEIPIDGEPIFIGNGGNMEATAGNILEYRRGDYSDYSIIFPYMAVDDTYTDEEKAIGKAWAVMGEEGEV